MSLLFIFSSFFFQHLHILGPFEMDQHEDDRLCLQTGPADLQQVPDVLDEAESRPVCTNPFGDPQQHEVEFDAEAEAGVPESMQQVEPVLAAEPEVAGEITDAQLFLDDAEVRPVCANNPFGDTQQQQHEEEEAGVPEATQEVEPVVVAEPEFAVESSRVDLLEMPSDNAGLVPDFETQPAFVHDERQVDAQQVRPRPKSECKIEIGVLGSGMNACSETNQVCFWKRISQNVVLFVW